MSCRNYQVCRHVILNATVCIAHCIRTATLALGLQDRGRVIYSTDKWEVIIRKKHNLKIMQPITTMKEIDHYLFKIERAVDDCRVAGNIERQDQT